MEEKKMEEKEMEEKKIEEQKMTIQEWHKKQAINNFNKTWDYIDIKERTEEDNLNMIHTAHASRFHWGEIGTPLEFARGEWQIARVYSLVGMYESALFHAQHSLNYCLNNNISGFDLAFGYEAVARAYMIGNNKESMEHYLQLATNQAEQITEKEDKEYFLSELSTICL